MPNAAEWVEIGPRSNRQMACHVDRYAVHRAAALPAAGVSLLRSRSIGT
jgi:hypothetical protein